MENFDLTKMTDEQLGMLQAKIVREQTDRKEKRKVDVVNAFEKAWRDLEEAGFTIHVKDADSFYDGDDIYFEEIEIY